MKTWTIAVALIVAGTMLAGSAFAQATPGSEPKSKAGESKSKAGDQKDKAKDSAGPGAMKSDTMKSDTMKPDMKADKSARPMAGGNREHVKAAQQALKDKGHDPGMIDGVMGPKTQAALKDFQGKEGLKASGRLDAETMAKLGVQAKAGASADSGTSSPSASPSTGAAGEKKDKASGPGTESSSPAASGSSGSSSTPGTGSGGTSSGSSTK